MPLIVVEWWNMSARRVFGTCLIILAVALVGVQAQTGCVSATITATVQTCRTAFVTTANGLSTTEKTQFCAAAQTMLCCNRRQIDACPTFKTLILSNYETGVSQVYRSRIDTNCQYCGKYLMEGQHQICSKAIFSAPSVILQIVCALATLWCVPFLKNVE